MSIINEHLDRIDEAVRIMHCPCPPPALMMPGASCPTCRALESLTVIRAHISDMERDEVALRRRIHQIEAHNQFFERCESGWCNPAANADPASNGVGAAWKTPAQYEAQITELSETNEERGRVLHDSTLVITGLRERIAELEKSKQVSPDAHLYTSTACHHNLHDRCRRECKFCSVACGCRCHLPIEDPT